MPAENTNQPNSEYRTRIYDHYVHARKISLAPTSIEAMKPRLHLLNKIINVYFPKNRDIQILDLGCGHGTFLYACQKAGYLNSSGVDSSQEQVDEAQRLGISGIKFGDLMATLRNHPDCSLDIVIAYDVIEHFTKQELLPFIDEVFRVLRKKGKWVVHTPNGAALFGAKILFSDFTHEMAFTATSITQVLKASGFDEIICIEDTPIPHGLKSAVRWFLWKFIRSLLRFYLAVETGAGERDSIFSQNFLTVASKP